MSHWWQTGLPIKWLMMNPLFKSVTNKMIALSNVEEIEKMLKRNRPVPKKPTYSDMQIERFNLWQNGLEIPTLHVRAINKVVEPDQKRKIILFFHGGGFVTGSPNDYISMFVELLRKTDYCEVFAPDYRKGPKFKYPAAQNDAWECYQHVLRLENVEITVMGDSAGGSLCGIICSKAIELNVQQPHSAILVYPSADTLELRKKRESYEKYGGYYFLLTKELTQWTSKQYFGNAKKYEYLNEKSWTQLTTPVLLMVAEYDIIHDEAVDLSKHMKADGANVDKREYPIVHGGLSPLGVICFRNVYNKMLNDIISFLRNPPKQRQIVAAPSEKKEKKEKKTISKNLKKKSKS